MSTEITRILTADDTKELTRFFLVLGTETSFFNPHPFNADEARRICFHSGLDLYLAHFREEKIVAYGLLRGWDEGFEHPSLGIAVDPKLRGSGIGASIMSSLHDFARAKGATKVRLRVEQENTRAKAFYERLGYSFEGEVESGKHVGWLRL